MDDDAADDLAAAIDDLAAAVDELANRIDEPQGRRSLAPGPPRSRSLLAVADEVAIPALIAVLRANVRALETFQRVLRVARTGRRAEEAVETSRRTHDHARRLRDTTLQQLDAALAALQRSVNGEAGTDDATSTLLADARALRDEVQRRLEELDDRRPSRPSDHGGEGTDDASGSAVRGRPIEIDDGPGLDASSDDQTIDEGRPTVDVDAELETLRDRYGDDAGNAEKSDGSNGDETDEGDADETDEGDADETDERDADETDEGDADESNGGVADDSDERDGRVDGSR